MNDERKMGIKERKGKGAWEFNWNEEMEKKGVLSLLNGYESKKKENWLA